MTRKEIVRRTIEFRNPPRIPAAFWCLDAGEAPGASRTPFINMLKQSCLDDIKCIDYRAADGGPVSRETGPGTKQDEWGVKWVDGFPVNHPLDDWDRWADYPFPDASAPARFEKAGEVIAGSRDMYLLGLVWNTTFERMWILRGIENLLLDPYVDCDKFLELRDRYLRFNLEILDRWLRTDVDAVYFGDDLGSQSGLIISPAMWREYYLPMYRELFGRTRSSGKHVFFHSCGNVMEITRDLVDCGLNVLNPVQPNAMNVKWLLREFGKDIVLWGATDLQEILAFETRPYTRGTRGGPSPRSEWFVGLRDEPDYCHDLVSALLVTST